LNIQENLIRLPAGLRDFPLPQGVHPAWGPPNLLFNNGGFYPEVNWLGREEGLLPPANPEVKITWNYTAIRLGLHRDSFNLKGYR